jgi:hypothetical protein
MISMYHSAKKKSLKHLSMELVLMMNFRAGMIRDSSVAKLLATGWMMEVRFKVGAGNFSLHHRAQTGSGSQPAPCPMDSGDLSLGVKRPGREPDHSPPSSAEVKDCVELYLHSPNMPSWRGARLKHRDNFTFTFISTQRLSLFTRVRET